MADVYRWRLAPDGLATRRQLRSMGLRPGGQDVVAELHRPRRRRAPLVAYLYRIDRAKPVRPMTPARAAALAAAMRARRTCPNCLTDVGYCIPRSLAMCVTCHDTPRPERAPHDLPLHRQA
ncbi:MULTISPECIES: RRQRL motif-containing zinc-binding protein [unclassified Streptomyces]|uniref:RRQRL motif-containing zinc-binding protein n=1 Tax=unclassified Streptomyces TaxID=2593676 RepID=UPI00099E4283|nr:MULTISPECIES: RRQRL motif-containing zinc-binding protein [unclassified Streptomyces]